MSNDEKCGTILNVFKFHISMPPPSHTFHRQHEVKKLIVLLHTAFIHTLKNSLLFFFLPNMPTEADKRQTTIEGHGWKASNR
jgi:hypothetical protein